MYELPEPHPPRSRLADCPSRDRASVSQLIPYLLRTARLAGQGGGCRPHCQLRMRTRGAAAIRPAARPPLASCPMLSGEPTYDCASVTKDRFPGATRARQGPLDHPPRSPRGQGPCTRNPSRNLTRKTPTTTQTLRSRPSCWRHWPGPWPRRSSRHRGPQRDRS